MSLDITLGNRSDASGCFNFVKDPITGDVSFDDTQAHAVMTSVIERKGGYWADPNHGSELYQLKNLSSATPTQAQASVLDALDLLDKAGLIQNETATATAGKSGIGGGALNVDVTWETPIAGVQTITILPIGNP